MEELIQACLLELALDYHQISPRVRAITETTGNAYFIDQYLDTLRPDEYADEVTDGQRFSRQLSKALAAKLLEKGVQLPNHYSK